ncbi:hypothetical protein LINPERHAP1_LOCUS21927 [Linum perenne]
MKFKAFLTENGVMLLERRFLPALDKMGKVCHLLLIRDHAFYLLCGQSSAPASNNASDDADDGGQSSAPASNNAYYNTHIMYGCL